ncbi:MAG: hypothetical protein NTW65_05225 [Deltaproteobacteria bacterium]|nr:hypothetical protein [Deltaproteobacteria bacterium]
MAKKEGLSHPCGLHSLRKGFNYSFARRIPILKTAIEIFANWIDILNNDGNLRRYQEENSTDG